MSNNFGSQIVNIFGDVALSQLGQDTVGATSFATDITTLNNGVAAGANSTVTVKTFSTAGTYQYNGAYTSTDITGSDTVVTLNRHAVAQRELTQDQLSSPYWKITVAELGKEMGQSMAEAVNTDFLSLFTSGNFTNFTIVNSGSFNRNALNSIASALSKRGVSKDDRMALLNNDYYNYLGNDQSVVTLTNLNPDVVSNINLPKIATFQPYEVGSTLFPQSAYSGSYNVVGALGGKYGVAFATRPIRTLDGFGTAAIYSTPINPKLGLAVTNTVIGDPLLSGKVVLRSEFAYGFSVGNAKALQLIVA